MQGWKEKYLPQCTAVMMCGANAGRGESELPGHAPARPSTRAGIVCRQGMGGSARGAVHNAHLERLVASSPLSHFFIVVNIEIIKYR